MKIHIFVVFFMMFNIISYNNEVTGKQISIAKVKEDNYTITKLITGRILKLPDFDELSKLWTEKVKFEIDSVSMTKLIFMFIIFKVILKTVLALFLVLITPAYKSWRDYEREFYKTSTTTTTTAPTTTTTTTEIPIICKKYGWYCPVNYETEYYYYD